MSGSELHEVREETTGMRELADRLQDKQPHVRRQAAEALAKFASDDEDATAALLAAVYDDDAEIRTLAFAVVKGVALRSIQLKKDVTKLTRDLKQTKDVLAEIISERSGSEEEPRRLQAELERSNRELEQFGYSVSHDLQAPLRTISSYCQLLRRRYSGQFDQEADEFLDGAIRGANRMKRLLDDLLTYSRVTTVTRPFLETDCNVVVDEVRNNLEMQIRETAAELITDSLPVVVGDRSQLMQLFQNLIGNAINYRGDLPPRIHISSEKRPVEWLFCVKDNGVGIEERHRERIFKVFQRLFAEHDCPGSGVGLSICKRIVERHGGGIWVESAPGHGSEFWFTIPTKPQDD